MSKVQGLIGNDLYKKVETLKSIYVDNKYWETFYLDEETREIWVKYHPYGEMQAGGPPELVRYQDYIKIRTNEK